MRAEFILHANIRTIVKKSCDLGNRTDRITTEYSQNKNMKGQKRVGSVKLKIILSTKGKYRSIIISFFHIVTKSKICISV